MTEPEKRVEHGGPPMTLAEIMIAEGGSPFSVLIGEIKQLSGDVHRLEKKLDRLTEMLLVSGAKIEGSP